MREKFGVGGFVLSDETFTLDEDWATRFCQAVAPLHMVWSAQTRADKLSQKLLIEMRSAGCCEIKLGAETGDEGLLERMNKKVTTSDIGAAAKMAYDVGMHVKLLLIHGLPGETAETTKATCEMLTRLRPVLHRVTVFKFCPLPGSRIWDRRSEYGVRWDISWAELSEGIHSDDSRHWWGTEEQHAEMLRARSELLSYVQKLGL